MHTATIPCNAINISEEQRVWSRWEYMSISPESVN